MSATEKLASQIDQVTNQSKRSWMRMNCDLCETHIKPKGQKTILSLFYLPNLIFHGSSTVEYSHPLFSLLAANSTASKTLSNLKLLSSNASKSNNPACTNLICFGTAEGGYIKLPFTVIFLIMVSQYGSAIES